MPSTRDISRLFKSNGVPSALDAAIVEQELTQIAQLKVQVQAQFKTQSLPSSLLSVECLPNSSSKSFSSPYHRSFACRQYATSSILAKSVAVGVMWSTTCGVALRSTFRRMHSGVTKFASWFRPSVGSVLNATARRPANPCLFANSEALKTLLKDGAALDHLEFDWIRPACFYNWIGCMQSDSELASTSPWHNLKSLTVKLSSVSLQPEATNFTLSMFHRLPYTHNIASRTSSCRRRLHAEAPVHRRSPHIPKQTLKRLVTFTIVCDWWGTHILDMLMHCMNVAALTVDTGPEAPFDAMDEQSPAGILLGHLSKAPSAFPNLTTLNVKSAKSVDLLEYIRPRKLCHLYISGKEWEAKLEREDFTDQVLRCSWTDSIQCGIG